jgi:hypothetical protein
MCPRITIFAGFFLFLLKTHIPGVGNLFGGVKSLNDSRPVTGLVVNDRPTLARKEIRRLRAILHRACTEGLDAQNREGRPHFRAWLQGKIAYLVMVRPELGGKLRLQFEALHTQG